MTNKRKQTVPLAVEQKRTYTFHVDNRKFVIEATSAEEARKSLDNIIRKL